MSDPRAPIARTVLAPPAPVAAPSMAARAVGTNAEEGTKLIGKPHGRMRCVNLSLTPGAKEALYERAAAENVTLGEALMDLVSNAEVPARRRRSDRAATMRRGVEASSVFVLLTVDEARTIAARAAAAGRSVSDFVSCAIA